MKHINDEIQTALSKMDCLIIIGSNASNPYISKILADAEGKVQKIEINPQALINLNQLYTRIVGDLEDIVPRLCQILDRKSQNMVSTTT